MGKDETVFEGRNLDDAVRKGLDALGLSRAEVVITVIDEGSGGFLGLGARPYRVRVVRRPGGPPRELEDDRDRGDRKARGRGGREQGGRGVRAGHGGGERRGGSGRRDDRRREGGRGGREGVIRSESRGPRDVPAREGRDRGERRDSKDRGDALRSERPDRPDRPERPDRPDRPDRPERPDRPDRMERAPRAEMPRPSQPPAEAAEGGEAGRRRRRRRGGRGRPDGEPVREPMREPSFERSAAPAQAPVENYTSTEEDMETTAVANGSGMPAPELEEQAVKLTRELFTAMGYEAEVTARAEANRVDVRAGVATGEDELTGRKGEVRQALQHILNRMINRGGGSAYHLQLEVNDFWERREAELRDLARQLADEAIAHQSETVTEYLNAQERRIVHVTLKEDSRVKTYALGTGLIKRVAVAPADFPEPSEPGE